MQYWQEKKHPQSHSTWNMAEEVARTHSKNTGIMHGGEGTSTPGNDISAVMSLTLLFPGSPCRLVERGIGHS